MCKKQKVYLLALILLTLGTMAMRAVEYLFAIDAQSGYYEVNSISVFGFGILCLISLIIFMSSMFALRDEVVSINIKFSSNLINAVFILLLITTAINISSEAAGFVTGQKDIFTIIHIIFAALFGVFLLVATFNSKRISYEMYLFPTLYCIARLVGLFIKYTGTANVSSKTFEIIALCALIMFFLYYSRAIVKGNGKKRTFAFGMCAVFFILIFTIPSLIFMNPVETQGNIVRFINSQIHYILLAVYILLIIVPSKMTRDEYEEIILKNTNVFSLEEDEEDYADDEYSDEEYADYKSEEYDDIDSEDYMEE